MGLSETLCARAARQGRCASVDCGALGTVTVEALPLRELELLLRGADGQRAVFYAACRELQAAGEALRQRGRVFTPDGVLQFVSDSEAKAAAEAVCRLSGAEEAETEGAADAASPVETAEEAPAAPAPPAQTETVLEADRLAALPPPTALPAAEKVGEGTAESAAVPPLMPAAQAHSGGSGRLKEPVDIAETGIREEPALRKTEGQRLPEERWESGERLARQLLEGLRRAKWVRGE